MSEIRFASISEFINVLSNQSLKYSGTPTDPPVVSIITSYYNSHLYFEETFRSIMNQTMQNFEWIIVDDRSTDPDAIALFETLEQRSEKIRTFRHKENKGLAAGRNTAISHATGKYLFFMDLDDLIDPTYLEKCVLFLELHPEFSFVNSRTVGFQEQEYWWMHGFEKSSRFIEENWVTAMLMYRKTDFEKLGGFDEDFRFYEDWERWLRALTVGQKGWTISEFLQCYRRLSSGLLSSSQQNEANKKRLIKQLHRRYAEPFKSNPPTSPWWSDPLTPYDVKNFRQRLQINNVLTNTGLKGKRLLFLYPHLEVGGADKYNLDLLGLLKEKGYQLTIATTLKENHSWHEHFYKITPDIFHLSNYGHDTIWLSIIRYLIESRQIDIVFISNSYFAYYMLPLLRNEYKEVAFIDNVHIYDPGWRVDGYPRLSRQFNEFFDAQIVSSKHLAEYNEREEPTTKGKFSVCTTNIESTEWKLDETVRRKIRQLYKISNETTLIIFPARLVPQKRPFFFVRIIKELIEHSLPVKAIIIGDGHLLEPIQQLIKELELEDFITLVPPVSSGELRSYYCAADIFLLPTEYEGISIAVFEAMTMQLPVVVSNVGGQKELVVEGAGYVVDKGSGDKSEIENYLKVLEPLVLDTKLRKRIGAAARQRIENYFTLKTMGETIEKVFVKALNSRQHNNQEHISLLMAEELLSVALECLRIERGYIQLDTTLHQLSSVYSHKSLDTGDIKTDKELLLQRELELLLQQKKSMEASRFWKIRQKWFRLKYKTGLSKYES